ncbi:MAG: 7TM domain-containing protein [Crocinitomicaceae bacterium]|nr:7TM domain-containing protein [Crocinitomicaceae bacterium]
MKIQFGVHSLIATLIIGSITAIALKMKFGFFNQDQSEREVHYSVQYDFELLANSDKEQTVKAFIPVSDSRQTIKPIQFSKAKISQHNQTNQRATWDVDTATGKQNINYEFDVTGRSQRYTIDPEIKLSAVENSYSEFTQETEFIESNDSEILELMTKLKNEQAQVLPIITSFFEYVQGIPAEEIKELMTAKEALVRNAASCNGKSRLFVALCRSSNIPARVVGGLILNPDRKKTSHLWAEVQINNVWIPFDALNNYFAFIPSNYLTIYKGDEYLVTHSSDMAFDYFYTIAENGTNQSFLESFNMWHISKQTGLSERLLLIMLLLPIGALIVAIFRNVIGLKTFGVFLPVLIAISFMTTGVTLGIISFLLMVGLISLLHIPLAKWGILHVPKLVVMLIAMIFAMIVILYLGVELNVETVGTLTFFPVVIMTITAEKYARYVVEEGFKTASRVMTQTLFVTLFSYFILASPSVHIYLMNYPELLLLFAAISILLGKWIGLRISEYRRFGWMIS